MYKPPRRLSNRQLVFKRPAMAAARSTGTRPPHGMQTSQPSFDPTRGEWGGISLCELRSSPATLSGWPLDGAGFTVEEIVGRGANGVVVRAVSAASRWQGPRAVALKAVPRGNSSARELALMLRLRTAEAHANRIIQLESYFFDREASLLVQVLPLFDSSLRAYIDEAPRATDPLSNIELARSAGRQLATALAHVHRLGIVHRDVKPENVLVSHRRGSADGADIICVLADFGAAKDHSRGAAESSPSLCYVCALEYRAPELFFAATTYTPPLPPTPHGRDRRGLHARRLYPPPPYVPDAHLPRRFSPDIWGLGCVVADAMLGGPRLFETDAAAAASLASAGSGSPAQLVTLVGRLGTPNEEDMLAMNPRLERDPYLYRLLQLPPRPHEDGGWQRRLTDGVKANHPGGRARMQWADEKAVEAPLNAAKRFLQRIFVYRPGLRPSAEACLGQPFLARWSGG